MLVGPCGSQLHLDPTATLHPMGREVTCCLGCPTLRSPQEQKLFLSHLPELLPGHGWHIVRGSFYTDHLGFVVLASMSEARDQRKMRRKLRARKPKGWKEKGTILGIWEDQAI